MNRFAAPIGAFVLLLVAFGIGLTRDPSALPSPFIGKPAPQFALPELHDQKEQVDNSSFSGSPVLVNFWATWCVGCRQEHAFLMRLAKDNVIPIYGINWRDDRAAAIEWLKQLGNPYVKNGFDGVNRTGIDWGVYGAPETFLVDGNGIVIYKHLGPLSDGAWQSEFVPRLLELASGQTP